MKTRFKIYLAILFGVIVIGTLVNLCLSDSPAPLGPATAGELSKFKPAIPKSSTKNQLRNPHSEANFIVAPGLEDMNIAGNDAANKRGFQIIRWR